MPVRTLSAPSSETPGATERRALALSLLTAGMSVRSRFMTVARYAETPCKSASIT